VTPVPPGLAAALSDRYRLDRELGQGGMATVYLAHDLKHGRQVAIKVLRPWLGAAVGEARFLREIGLTAQLQHPHILPLLDSGAAAGMLYYAMPYVEEETLRQRLQRDGQLSVEESLRLTTEVAEALEYAHQQGILHRDVKPENILLSRGHALLADFGIAVFLTSLDDRLTETGLSLGTPAYMSPEQALAEPDLDGRTDQYSLACVLYEMLVGKPPHVTMLNRLREPAPRLSAAREVPRAVDQAVARALAPAKADRFTSMGDFRAALSGVGPVEPDAPFLSAKRMRLLVALTGTAAVILLVTRSVQPTSADGALNPRRVLIAPFENRTGEATLEPLGLMVAEWLTQGLTGTALVDVVDSRSLTAPMQGLPRQSQAGDAARDLAKTAGAQTLVSGSIYRLGDSLRFQAQVRDAGTGQLRATMDPVTVTAASPAAALEPLRQRVTGALATLLDDRLNAQGAVAMHPPTFEAYQEFVQGMENYGRHTEADLQHFRRAASLDTSYTQALLWVGIAHADLEQYRQADSVLQLVEARRVGLAPYDQANLDYFRQGFVQGDWEASYQGARRMLALSPSAPHAKWAVALAGSQCHRFREALRVLATIDTSRGWGKSWRQGVLYMTATADHALAEYADELRAADALAADSGATPVAGYVWFRALVGLHRKEEALTHVQQDSLGWWFYLAAGQLLAHGYPEDSRVMAARAVAALSARIAAAPGDPHTERDLGMALLAAGAWGRARALAVEGLRRDTSEVTWHGILGLVMANAGDTLHAARELRLLSAWPARYLFGRPSWWRARILGREGRSDEAIAALEQAYREGLGDLGYPDVTGHLESAEFDAIRGDARVQALLRPRD
jgi:serine/threonine-protein kinase